MNIAEFRSTFQSLTGNAPFPWQEALFSHWFSQGKIPSCCDLPTGLGKTSVVAVWLIALAAHQEKMPRRLVYVVNRRTVVDQTTSEAEQLRENLTKPNLKNLRDDLAKLVVKKNEPPLAISTLRGQMTDNREWSDDPFRPAIIIGTVDMIGSKLLFNGYGAGYKRKPLFAGFLGQDALIVHDEAHLEPAFQDLLEAIEAEQSKNADTDARKIKVMQLSATRRKKIELSRVLELGPDDEKHEVVMERLNAKKKLVIHPEQDSKTLPEKLASLALAHRDSGNAILVFARKVETVEKVVGALHKANQHQVVSLTGTMRGKERDDLVRDNAVFRRFLPEKESEEAAKEERHTVYLVCTSAGEVGVNISADHLVCDLSTFDSMAQRFGRVNRFGQCEDTRIDVVPDFDKKEPLFEHRQKTLALFNDDKLKGEAGPAALGRLPLDERLAAFSPCPDILPTSDILFDSWSLTSITDKLPGRPLVEPYLHGVTEYELPETTVAWRWEVEEIATEELLGEYSPEDLLARYPLKPHELLRDRSDRVYENLTEIARRHAKAENPVPVWLLDDAGAVAVLTLSELADKNKKDRIDRGTIILPPCAGGLSKEGLLDGSSEHATDVADEWIDDEGKKRRLRIMSSDRDARNLDEAKGLRRILTIDTAPEADDLDEGEETDSLRYWHWFERPSEADNDGSAIAREPVALDDHIGDVEKIARQFADKLSDSESDLKQALVLAARFHDLGKNRIVWQRSIGNFNGAPLAKSNKPMKWQGLEGYRHEFGSLLDIRGRDDFQKLPEDVKDVVLHLVAAHHGRARPHFPREEILDPEHSGLMAQEVALEVPRRFARLQRRYGRWGLAWLESLLRAADYAASANPSKTVETHS